MANEAGGEQRKKKCASGKMEFSAVSDVVLASSKMRTWN